jgi:type IV fimbrial biogenesis protein FimT
MFNLNVQKGVTLIELLITVTILGIIMATAAPRFSAQIANSRSVAASADFVEALASARSQARSRSGMVVLCPANDSGTSCGENWSNGWLIATDTSATETESSVTVGNVLSWINDVNKKTIISSDHGFIRFTSKGFLAGTSGSTADVEISLTGCEGPAARRIHIEASGITSVSKINCADVSEENY